MINQKDVIAFVYKIIINPYYFSNNYKVSINRGLYMYLNFTI